MRVADPEGPRNNPSTVGVLLLLLVAGGGSAALGSPAEADPYPFQLVRDLEPAPAHGEFSGWVLETETASLTLSQGILWRIEEPGRPATPLLREVWSYGIHDLGKGAVAVVGTEPTSGVEAVWLTNGGPPQYLAPIHLAPQAPWFGSTMARHDGEYLAKSRYAREGPDSFWSFSETASPRYLGYGGTYSTADDPTFPSHCAGVVSTPTGSLHCRRNDEPYTGATIWLRSGDEELQVPGFTIFDLYESTTFGDNTYVLAGDWHTGEELLIRSNGTPAGTHLVDWPASGPMFEWGDSLAWFRHDPVESWQLRILQETGAPRTLVARFSGQPKFLGVAHDELYLQERFGPPPGTCRILRVSLDGSVTALDTGARCAASRVVDLDRQRAVAFLFEIDRTSSRLWEITAKAVSPLTPTVPGAAALTPRAEGLLIPWPDPAGRWRMSRMGRDGIEPWDGLSLGGSAGSHPAVLGEFSGEALIFSITNERGASFWLSRGTSASTRPMVPSLPSQCTRWSTTWPSLIDGNTILDCPSSRTRVWIFDELARPRELEIDLSATFTAPRGPVVRLRDHLIHPTLEDLMATPVAGGLPVRLLEGCSAPHIAQVGEQAVVACNQGGGTVWATDGTATGTTALLSLGQFQRPGPIAKVGDFLVLSVGTESWITDGTSAGTRPLGPIAGVAETDPGATWTCAWGANGEIFRLDLASLELVTLAQSGSSSIAAVLKRPLQTSAIPLWVSTSSGPELWRCDGTPEGTRRVADMVPDFNVLTSVAGAGDKVWTYAVTGEASRERLVEFSLDGINTPKTLLDRVLVPNDDQRVFSFYFPLVARLQLAVAAGHLWAPLADAAHGREPRVLPLRALAFADGFESGDTSAWPRVISSSDERNPTP